MQESLRWLHIVTEYNDVRHLHIFQTGMLHAQATHYGYALNPAYTVYLITVKPN